MGIFVPCDDNGGGGGGFAIADGTVLTFFESLSSGFDTAVNFQSAIFDDIANRVIIAGSNDFVGEKTLVNDKLVVAPSLPASNNTCRGIVIDRLTGGAVFLDSGNGIFLSDANLDNWAAIPSGAVAVKGIFALTDTNNLYAVFDTLAAPNRNVAVSADQGTTWDINPGIFAPFGNLIRFTVMSPDKSHVAICGTGGGDVAVSNDPVNTWVAHTVATANDIVTAAFSADNTVLIVSDSIGRLFFTETPLVAGALTEISVNTNPFLNSATSGRQAAFLHFVPSISGFVAIDTNEFTAVRIPQATLATPEQGLYVGRTVAFPTTERFSPFSVTDITGVFQAVGTVKGTIVFLS
jgi:hypothetical protein